MRMVYACALVAVAGAAHGDIYEPPAGYYSSAAGLTGAALKNELHNIIDDHTVLTYGDARTILQDLDVDPNDPNSIILVYEGDSLDVSLINPGGSIPGWDSGISWNREHCWPRSSFSEMSQSGLTASWNGMQKT